MKILHKSSSSGSLISFADADADTQIFFKYEVLKTFAKYTGERQCESLFF